MSEVAKLIQEFNKKMPDFYKVLYDKKTTKKDIIRALQAITLHPYAHEKVEFTGKKDKALFDVCVALEKIKTQSIVLSLREHISKQKNKLEKKDD